MRVNPAVHHAADVGDEPLLLARLAPTIVARDRVAGAKFAQFAGASVIVMDDGFQNPSLAKDLAILLVDGRRGIGNGRIIPAGPLRAPLGMQLERAQALVVVGPPDGAASVVDRATPARHCRFSTRRLEPDAQCASPPSAGAKCWPSPASAIPTNFLRRSTEAGIAVAERASFADHHRYTAAEAQALIGARTSAQALMLITTEKDLARLAGDPAAGRARRRAPAHCRCGL